MNLPIALAFLALLQSTRFDGGISQQLLATSNPHHINSHQKSQSSERYDPADVSLVASSETPSYSKPQDTILNEMSSQEQGSDLDYSQQQKLRVNVSNICEKDRMQITVRLNRPFYGLIHAKDKRKKSSCMAEGNGSQAYLLYISYTQIHSDPDYCGVLAHQPLQKPITTRTHIVASNQSSQQQVLSLVLVVRMHKTIEFSEDKYFLLSCANRCSKSDCSAPSSAPTLTNGQQDPRQISFRSNMMTSESSLFPRFRSIAQDQLEPLGTGTARQVADSSWPNESRVCDSMLDLKFKWLWRLCWILASLTSLMFIMVLYLCLVIRRKRHKSDSGSNFRGPHSHFVQANERYLPWHESRSSKSTSSGSDQATTNSSCIVAGSQLNYEQQQQQQQQHFHFGQHRPVESLIDQSAPQGPVIGRSMDTFGRAKKVPARGPTNEPSLIRRRRSIGSSMQQNTGASDLNYQQAKISRQNQRKLDDSTRERSRSQVTIHYDQSQDPFKTNPFGGFINSGYMSDGAAVHQSANENTLDAYEVLTGSRHEPMSYSIVKRPPSPAQMDHSDRLHHSTPMGSISGQQPVLARPNEWSNRHNFSPVEQPAISGSQFDPKNSRQLIDLIQQKHRNQLAQATLTAASMPLNGLLAELQSHQNQSHNQNPSNQNWR